MVVVIDRDVVRGNLTMVEAGVYQLIRCTATGYLIRVNEREHHERVLAQIKKREGRLYCGL